mmetsp:Transcript_20509/g.36379  ORF Transcript_20509/g.36379 Transcript_20509/m.36379 type:complete len:196 (-) Transcript_20509:76-663(-)|eukprot:CAMPEP_0115099518 /NCGR_PEP_ID=MMETSP0227-20121206/31907_1 /TAXON_ID=89957 /ORGANISM="Polarella glacialis, Strain CCMP 1383" /LENGTH=195 /DNA_ID=CAMNT_0002494539 /DNA_START=248 /DNA_END=835 /DNA_ORIENTATION=-
MEKLSLPVFVQNPDGSVAHGIPPGYKEPTPPGTPRARVTEPNLTNLNADIVRVLAKHELIFISLLFLELGVEITFEVLQVKYREDAVFELSLLYPALSIEALGTLHWMAFAGECCYGLAFFVLGMVAACTAKPRLYQRFSTVAIIGTVGQLPMAYLNRFNLLVFFLRFIAYAYARFQFNLLRTIDLIRADVTLPP